MAKIEDNNHKNENANSQEGIQEADSDLILREGDFDG